MSVMSCHGGLPCPFNTLRKNPFSSSPLSTLRNKDIQNIAVLVDGSPEIKLLDLVVAFDASKARRRSCQRPRQGLTNQCPETAPPCLLPQPCQGPTCRIIRHFLTSFDSKVHLGTSHCKPPWLELTVGSTTIHGCGLVLTFEVTALRSQLRRALRKR